VSINIGVVEKAPKPVPKPGVCEKSSKASAKAGGSWLEKCGSRNQKPGLWPILK